MMLMAVKLYLYRFKQDEDVVRSVYYAGHT